jgi:hypothetical protein
VVAFCLDRGPSALFCPGVYNAVETTLPLTTPKNRQQRRVRTKLYDKRKDFNFPMVKLALYVATCSPPLDGMKVDLSWCRVRSLHSSVTNPKKPIMSGEVVL